MKPNSVHNLTANTSRWGNINGGGRIDWFACVPMIVVHTIGVVGPFLVPFAWKWVLLAAVSYAIRMFGITACYHRYFAHKTYKLSRFWQFIAAILGGSATQKGALWWAAMHRHHHRHSDQETDLHSPAQDGILWAHVGWMLSKDHEATKWQYIPELAKFPELRFLNRHHWIPPTLCGVSIFLVWGWPGVIWGYFFSQVLLWHGTFVINSLCHVFGSQRFASGDTSRNNFWLALLTHGEGWHNNHHAYEWSTRQGFYWWEWDPSYYTLKVLSWIGVVSDIKEPNFKLLETRLLQHHPKTAENQASLIEQISLFKKRAYAGAKGQ